MRTKLATSALVFILTFILTTSLCTTGQGLIANKIIVIDPGHGGIYPGAIANGVREADVNLAVCLKLRDRLNTSGATVVMTRISDMNLAPPGAALTADLQARVDVAKDSDADIFVSIHANAAADDKITGTISFYGAHRPSDLAQSIQLGLGKEDGVTDKGIRPANFYVLRNNEVPSALIEMGFLTNPTEAARLTDDAYQNQLADGICNGIFSYFQSR